MKTFTTLFSLLVFLICLPGTNQLQAQCSPGTEQVIVNVMTNGAWTKIRWSLEDKAGNVLYIDHLSRLPSNTSNTLFSDTACVPTGTDLNFKIFDTRGYGLCCEFGDGFYEVLVNGDQLIYQEGFLTPEHNLGFQVPLAATDLALRELTSYDSVVVGLHWMQGLVHNTGKTAITDFAVNWSVDGKSPHKESFSGVSIAPGQKMDWQHAVGLPAEMPGIYNVKAWLSDINGGTDAVSCNDTLSNSFTAIVPNRNVLVEATTNFYCGPCAGWMPVMAKRIRDNQQFVFGLLMHSDGWSARDIIYLDAPMQNDRLDMVYQGTTHPRAYVDGESMYPDDALRRLFLEDAMKPRIFSVDKPEVQLDLTNQTISFTSMVRADQNYNASNLLLHQVIIEEHIPLPVQPNGEDHADFAMKTMLPDFNGTAMPMAIAAGDSFPVSGTWKMTNVYDPQELGVLVFVQDMNTKEILQVNYGAIRNPINPNTTSTGIDKVAAFSARVFPNPTSDYVELFFGLESADHIQVQVTDISGRIVRNLHESLLPAGAQRLRFGLSGLPSGTYLLQLSSREHGSVGKRVVKE